MTPIARITRWLVNEFTSCAVCHNRPRVISGMFCSEECADEGAERQAFSM